MYIHEHVFYFGVSKSSACYNLELIAERFISKVIRITSIMIKYERFDNYFFWKTYTLYLCVLSSDVHNNKA